MVDGNENGCSTVGRVLSWFSGGPEFELGQATFVCFAPVTFCCQSGSVLGLQAIKTFSTVQAIGSTSRFGGNVSKQT